MPAADLPTRFSSGADLGAAKLTVVACQPNSTPSASSRVLIE
jgi:hypothetical protein